MKSHVQRVMAIAQNERRPAPISQLCRFDIGFCQTKSIKAWEAHRNVANDIQRLPCEKPRKIPGGGSQGAGSLGFQTTESVVALN